MKGLTLVSDVRCPWICVKQVALSCMMQTAVCRCGNVTQLPALQSWAKVMRLLG